MQLTPAQIERFHADGYMVIDRLISEEDVLKIAAGYDQFLRREINCGDQDRMLGGKTRQVMNPSQYHPLFKDNPALSAAKKISEQLLGYHPNLQFDMLISKEAGNRNETPWHQDYAYSQMPFKPAGSPMPAERLQFWVALDDVDVSNGCMHFIPGVHKGKLREHFVAGGDPTDPGRLLAFKPSEEDTKNVVACPLKKGGCTIHFDGTPHFTTGNVTKDRNRRAYIFNLGTVRKGA
jgi:ectoine hydroxylase-related dioxygenase (phytanoyl-CoA dioxygenase family)